MNARTSLDQNKDKRATEQQNGTKMKVEKKWNKKEKSNFANFHAGYMLCNM